SQTLGLLLWGDEFEAPPGMPGSLDHYLCAEDKIRFFADPTSWLRFLAGQDFACGTRIHGNVAALLAGIPAYQLAHDSRTLELARFHQIPHQVVPDEGWAMDAATLYEQADLSAFNAARDVNRDLWLAFLDRNGLPHRDRPDPDYDALVTAAARPDGVGPLTAAGPAEIASRLRWLHQGLRPGDAVRTHGAYQPEFAPAGAAAKDVLTRIAELRGVVSEQAGLIRAQQKELAALTTRLERQQGQLKALTAATRPLYRKVGGWLRRRFRRR
ncbi:MAG: polysaccharide pyruvyl transferase family protein, partial [Propionicimonas sp.]|nr:polysaccharide pyruvyl transferase family protein [Propionicimonas sp.]